MASFLRRFVDDPGNDVLLDIESINVIDKRPPPVIQGVNAGTVLVVGEFEKGKYNTPTLVSSAVDLAANFGDFGYAYGDSQSNFPSAVARKADGATANEFWNGNAFVQLSGKNYGRLLVCRADTSIGKVQFRKQAFITGNAASSYKLADAETLNIQVEADTSYSIAFDGNPAELDSATGSFPATPTAGDTLVIEYDGITFTTIFLATDTTQALMIARINQYAGFTMASDQGSSVTRLSTQKRGTSAYVRVVSGTAGILTALGFTAGQNTAGTGNVSDIENVIFSEIKAVIEAGSSNTLTVEKDLNQLPRISKKYVTDDDYLLVNTATTALIQSELGFTAGKYDSLTGLAKFATETTFGGGALVFSNDTLVLGVDDENDVTVDIDGSLTLVQVVSLINTAMGFTCATNPASTNDLLLTGRQNGGQIRLVSSSSGATSPAVVLNLGTLPRTIQANADVNITIPAGTRICDPSDSTKLFLTTQDIATTATNSGTFEASIRHAKDDGTGTAAIAASLTKLIAPIQLASFSVSNTNATAVAMTEGQLDAAYQTAIDATNDLNSIAREANFIVSARQSNAVRRALRANAITASGEGSLGRVAVLRLPMGTQKTLFQAGSLEPSPLSYRGDRVIFSYINTSSFIASIAAKGLSGGDGFTADGLVDTGLDFFICSVASQLAPEQNPGQATNFANNVVAFETALQNVNLSIDDYKLFKSKGVVALRFDEGLPILQSGVVNVDPLVDSSLTDISTRRMKDFIQDSLSRGVKPYAKRLSSFINRAAISTVINNFLSRLLSRNAPELQRIDGYTVDPVSPNTSTTLAQGLFVILVKVRLLPSLKAITLRVSAGEDIEVTEVIAQAA